MDPANLSTKWRWIVELARKKKSLTSELRMVSPAARIIHRYTTRNESLS
jgi:hypothetical protein